MYAYHHVAVTRLAKRCRMRRSISYVVTIASTWRMIIWMRMSRRISSIMMKSVEWDDTKRVRMSPMGWVIGEFASEIVRWSLSSGRRLREWGCLWWAGWLANEIVQRLIQSAAFHLLIDASLTYGRRYIQPLKACTFFDVCSEVLETQWLPILYYCVCMMMMMIDWLIDKMISWYMITW